MNLDHIISKLCVLMFVTRGATTASDTTALHQVISNKPTLNVLVAHAQSKHNYKAY